jgi:hypothetical protein
MQVDDDGSELDKKHRFEDEAVEEAGFVSSDEDDDDDDAEDNAEDAAVDEAGSDASDEDGDDEDEEDDADSCADDAVAEACAALRNRRSFKVIVWRIEWQLRGLPHFHYAVYFIHSNVTGCIGIPK